MVWPRLPAAQQRCYWSESVQVNRQRSFGHLAITSAAIATRCFSQFKKKSPLSTVKQTVLLRLLFCLSLLNFADAINILAGKLRHYLFCCYDCIQLVYKSKLERGGEASLDGSPVANFGPFHPFLSNVFIRLILWASWTASSKGAVPIVMF